MPLEDIKDPKERMRRLENVDDEIFKQAYLEVQAAFEYATKNFAGFPMHRQLERTLEKYALRYLSLQELTD